MPDFKEQFIIYTDACDEGLGAVLCQIDKVKKCQPVAFYSKKLTARVRKYAIGEKKFMAIVIAMVHLKVYLYGREFIVRTDHRPLQWLRNLAYPSTRLARWLLIVRQFEFRIEFVSGISNAAADALSRFFIYGNEEEEDETEPGVVLNNVSLNDSDQKQGDQDIETLKSWILSGAKPDKQEESNSNELNCYYRHFDKLKVVVVVMCTGNSKQNREKMCFSTWCKRKASTSTRITAWLSLVGTSVAKSRTAPYHPQADGLTKRFNRTLEGMIRCFIEENLSDWDEYLDPLVFAYNTAVHATTRVHATRG